MQVGSGLNDEERQRVDTQLRPILTEVTSTVPPCILATGLEKPDVWVTDPSRSIVFAVGADVRRIATKIYFTGLSLRFPRVHGIRDDKSPSMADKQEDLKDTLEDKWKEAEQIRQEEEAGGVGTRKRRRKAGVGGGGNKRPKVGMLPEHLKLADVSKIEVVSDALKGCFIYVANTDGKDSMTKPQVAAMIKQLGGMEVAQHTYSKITHFVAGNGEGKRVKNLIAADKDVVSLSWLARCRAGLKKEPLRPNDYIHMSAATRAKLSQEGIQGPASAEDVAARLRHMRLADIDLAALMDKLLAVDPELEGHLNDRALPSEATKDSPRAFTPLLDALLARKGLLDARRSLLHGCTMLVVNVDPPAVHAAHDPFHGRLLATGPPLLSMARRVRSADVAAGATVTKLGTRGMALKAGLHGAQVVDAMSPAVTHVVGIQVRSPGGVMPFASHGGSQEERETEEEEATVTADVVLPAVRDQGGGPEGVATLEKAVGEGAVSLVSGEWLQECFDEAEKAKPPGEVPGPQDVFLPDAKGEHTGKRSTAFLI